MKYQNQQRASILSLGTIVIILLGLLVFLPRTAAGFDWLDKGKELFHGGMKIKPRPAAPLTEKDITTGLKEALRVSSDQA